MNNAISVQGHPSSADAYTRHGWKLVPIPPGTKGPALKGWNLKEKCITDSHQIPPGYGIGLAHAYSGTMSLDIDDWETAHREMLKIGIDLTALYQAPDAVIIDSGRAGHGKLLYAMPFGAALPSKKLIAQNPDGSKYNYLDFRCATSTGVTVQDVLPPSVHPVTGQPYRWAGLGKWENLPLIPQRLLDYWQSLIDQDSELNIPTTTHVNASWQEIEEALECIDPSLNRDEWVMVGMSLHWAGLQTDNEDHALYLWNEWSKGSDKYPGERGIWTQWRSFKGTDKGVKLGTFFHIAKEHGFTRKTPDASQLFSAVNNDPEHQLIDPTYLIKGLRPTVPELDLNLIPKVLKERSEEISVFMGVDPLVAIYAGLAAVSAAVDSQSQLELAPGFRVPPILWLMTLGSPAERKSPASKPILEPLRDIEREDRPHYKKRHLAWEGREAAYDAAKKSFLEYMRDPESMLDNDAIPTVPDLDEEPAPLRMVVKDITSQKLIRIAAPQPRGVLCHLDEMNSWVKKITDKMSGEDRSSWTVAYEGGHHSMDRVGAGSIHCENYAVSIYGNIQPDVYWSNVKSLGEDGLLQRFCPAILRPWDAVPQPPRVGGQTEAERNWEMTLRLIYGLPVMTYFLSPEAKESFRAFQYWYSGRKERERILNSNSRYMTAFGKLEGLCGRMMMIFHLMTEPFSNIVSGETADRVIDFLRTYHIPALRYLLNGAEDDEETLEEWLIGHVVQISGEVNTVTLRDLKRSARNRINTLKRKGFYSNHDLDMAFRDGMDTLEKVGYVIMVEDDPRQNRFVWSVNPRIAEVFESYRKERIIAKQKILDDCYMKLTTTGRTDRAKHYQAIGFNEAWREEIENEDD